MQNGRNETLKNRREFLEIAALASGAAAMGPHPLYSESTGSRKPQFLAFIKPLQSLSYEELADKIAEMGFNGIEATVRPGGHVLPERVEKDLPRLVEALKTRDLSVMVMATRINEISDKQRTKAILRTAASLGIPRFRMGRYKYKLSEKASLPEQLESFKAPLSDVIALGRTLGIQALYQNHSGSGNCGASLWDLYSLMKDYPKEAFASAFDVGHATVEGGHCWPQYLALMYPHIEMIYVKGPIIRNRDIKWGPLKESALDSKKLFGMLKKAGYSGNYNIHVEYHKTFKDMVPDTIAAMKDDLATLKRWLASA